MDASPCDRTSKPINMMAENDHVGDPLMTTRRKSFVREDSDQRRRDLIRATLKIIGKSGLQAATTRAIAAEADVTLGLIRHYFSTKEALVNAAYEYHMAKMTELALAPAEGKSCSRGRLVEVVRANLTAPVMSEYNVTLWASFISQVSNEPMYRATHHRTYLVFRARLEELIVEVLHDAKQQVSPVKARQLAIAINAIIDGLWLEGGAFPSESNDDDLVQIALDKIGLILGVEFSG